MRLSKTLGVSWPTAHRILRKLRIDMGHRDSMYRMADWVEVDDGRREGNARESARVRRHR